ncbi:N-acetyltransferase [Acinetobacter baumannii]|uniref:N-acetyltransferase n=1 Tax=Acinetobacter baumannii TaxID=470 RepID=UPI00389266B2
MIKTKEKTQTDGYDIYIEHETGIFQLKPKNKDYLGWIFFNKVSEVKTSPQTKEAKIIISIRFLNRNGKLHEQNNTFCGSFSKNFDGCLTASISKPETTSGHGGIYLDPEEIRGYRVGSLAMDHIVHFLKNFPSNTTVNAIKFKPNNETKEIAQNFYTKFGIPLSNTFSISDLKNNDNWKENLIEYTLYELIQLNDYCNQELIFLKDYGAELQKVSDQIFNEKKNIFNIIFGGKEVLIPILDFTYIPDEEINEKVKQFNFNVDDISHLLQNTFKNKTSIKKLRNDQKNLIQSLRKDNAVLDGKFDLNRLIDKLKLNAYFIIFLIILVIIIYLKIRTTIG